MYIWKSIVEIDVDKAVKCFDNRVEVYLLDESNDTGIIASNIQEIRVHASTDGILGIEKALCSEKSSITCNHCGKSITFDVPGKIRSMDFAIKI